MTTSLIVDSPFHATTAEAGDCAFGTIVEWAGDTHIVVYSPRAVGLASLSDPGNTFTVAGDTIVRVLGTASSIHVRIANQ
jgi:hypothetical protein